MAMPLTTHKRWRLRHGIAVAEVLGLVSERIVPHYAELDDGVELGFEVIDDRTVLATQRWPSRAARDAVMSGAAFDSWWEAYVPILVRWDELVELIDEWEADVWI